MTHSKARGQLLDQEISQLGYPQFKAIGFYYGFTWALANSTILGRTGLPLGFGIARIPFHRFELG